MTEAENAGPVKRRRRVGSFAEEYTAAVAHLADPAPVIRLGGVLALTRIADGSERDRATCLQMLCAYLRLPFDPDGPEADAGSPGEWHVRLAAQNLVAERLRPDHPGFWRGAQVDLDGAYLSGPDFCGIVVDEFRANRAVFDRKTGRPLFIGATFHGDARFQGATFASGPCFRKAAFGGDASFDQATFDGWVNFSLATFSGRAGFSEATFHRDAAFTGAVFSGYTTFGSARFGRESWWGKVAFDQGVSFTNAEFQGPARFHAMSFGSSGAWFDHAVFQRQVRFGPSKFQGDAHFHQTAFRCHASFRHVTFGRAARFGGASFSPDHPPEWPDGFDPPA